MKNYYPHCLNYFFVLFLILFTISCDFIKKETSTDSILSKAENYLKKNPDSTLIIANQLLFQHSKDNFEDKKYKAKYIPTVDIPEEETFVYNPAPITKPQITVKPLVTKSPLTQVFKITKEEPKKEDNQTKLASQDSHADNQSNTNSNPLANLSTLNGNIGISALYDLSSVGTNFTSRRQQFVGFVNGVLTDTQAIQQSQIVTNAQNILNRA